MRLNQVFPICRLSLVNSGRIFKVQQATRIIQFGASTVRTSKAELFPFCQNDDNHHKSSRYLGVFSAALLAVALIYSTNKPEKYIASCEAGSNRGSKSHILLSRSFVADAVEAVGPAVVNIICPVEGLIAHGVKSGSGFIISSDGFIVTNAHVVANVPKGKIIVNMENGTKRSAIVHSMDVQSDIALVKLETKFNDQLPTVKFGHSSKIRAGEFVIAIGSPMQLQNSASLGIVSAPARHASELGMSNNRSEYIQTDAAINVGNSGGPLINLDGEVVGINTMKVRDIDGISFAIPIDVADQVIRQLKSNRRVVRPYVGLKMANFIPSSSSKGFFGSREKNDIFNTEQTLVIVKGVVEGSPAHRAGIMSGDLITEINGKKVSGVRDVLNVIGLEVGKHVTLKVKRQDVGELTLSFITAPQQ